MSSNSIAAGANAYRPNIRPIVGSGNVHAQPLLGKPRSPFLDQSLMSNNFLRRELISAPNREISIMSRARLALDTGVNAIRDKIESTYLINSLNSFHLAPFNNVSIFPKFIAPPISASELIFSKPLQKQLLALAAEQFTAQNTEPRNALDPVRLTQRDTPCSDAIGTTSSSDIAANNLPSNASFQTNLSPLQNKTPSKSRTYRNEYQAQYDHRDSNAQKNKKPLKKMSLLNKIITLIFNRIIYRG